MLRKDTTRALPNTTVTMLKDYNLIKIVLLRLARGGVGAVPLAGAIVEHLMFGTWEDIQAARDKATIRELIEAMQEQVTEMRDQHTSTEASLSILRLLNKQKTSEFHGQRKISPGEINRLDGLITNFIDCVKNPLQAEPSPELEDAIKSRAISKGKLVRSYALPDEKRVVIDISDLEIGKWFFPLHFIRCGLQIPELQTEPLNALVDPPTHLGYPKSICVDAKVGQFTLTAYPKPVVLDSVQTGTPSQLDEVRVDANHSSVKFEYWPNGRKHPQFLVTTTLSHDFQLEFQEKGEADSSILCLRMSYD